MSVVPAHPVPEYAKLSAALIHASAQLITKVGEIRTHQGEFGPNGIDAAIRRSIAPEIKRHLQEMTAALELYERATMFAPRESVERNVNAST